MTVRDARCPPPPALFHGLRGRRSQGRPGLGAGKAQAQALAVAALLTLFAPAGWTPLAPGREVSVRAQPAAGPPAPPPVPPTGGLLPPTASLPGLGGPVQVVRDRFGVTHVYAGSPADAAFALGYLHAADRLFQMDMARRRAEGTLAELLGPQALPEDVAMRTLGLARAAERVWPNLSPGARAELEAYAAGANAFISRAVAQGALPPEYASLELTRVRPWRPQDSLSVLKLFAFQLSFRLEAAYAAILRAYVEALGPERGQAAVFQDLWRLAPVEQATVIPDAVGFTPRTSGLPETSYLSGAMRNDGFAAGPDGGPAGSAADQRVQDPTTAPDTSGAALAAQWAAAVAALPAFSGGTGSPAGWAASNGFVVSPRLSASGNPILANDPHQLLTAPPLWYAQHVVAGSELDVAGVALAGLPWVILGFNRHVAWGLVASPADNTDTFVERLAERDGRLFTEFRGQLEPVVAIAQRFLVNRIGDGAADNLRTAGARDGVPEAVLETARHGPIVRMDRESGRALSVQWTGFYSLRDGEAFYRWNRARDLGEFVEGLADLEVPALNLIYADVDGNVAYFAAGKIPLREDLDAGHVDGGLAWAPFLLRDGTGLRQHEWKAAPRPSSPQGGRAYEALPASEMPHVVNPARGFLVSANNDPLGTTLDGDPLDGRRFNGGIYYLASAYDPGFRAARITELIRERIRRSGSLSASDAMAIQADVVQLHARRLLPFLLAAWDAAERAAAAPPTPTSGAPGAVLARFRTAAMAEAIEYLRQWDFSTPTGVAEGFDAADRAPPGEPPVLNAPGEKEARHSVAATIFNVWVSQLIRHAIDAPLAAISPSLPRPDGASAVRALIHQLEQFDSAAGRGASGIRFFDIPELDLPPAVERDVVLLRSLEDALALLGSGTFEAAFGRRSLAFARWGRLHRLVLRHPLGRDFSIPPLGGFEGDAYLEGIPVDGGFEVVDASGFDPRAASPGEFRFESGPSVRLVVEMARDRVQAFVALAGSPTGNPADPDYGRLLAVWLANDYYPLLTLESDVRQAAVAVWTLAPEPPAPAAGSNPQQDDNSPGAR